MTRHRPLSFTTALVASVLLATLASSPLAQTAERGDGAVDPGLRRLRAAYLHCERAASERMLGSGDAAHCSLVYEKLLEVGFGGDFRRLLAWWHAERAAQVRSTGIPAPDAGSAAGRDGGSAGPEPERRSGL